jgi:hypothetical protein
MDTMSVQWITSADLLHHHQTNSRGGYMSEVNETVPETTKKTRFTINQALKSITDRVESYVTVFDEEKTRARYAAMKPSLDPALIEQCIASQKKSASVKLTGTEHDALEAETYSIVTTFYSEQEKERKRDTLPSVLEPLALAKADARTIFFAVESFIAEQAKRKVDAASAVKAATK